MAGKKSTPTKEEKVEEIKPISLDESIEQIDKDVTMSLKEEKVESLIGKKISLHTNTLGKVRLFNKETRMVITGFIPMSLAKQQMAAFPHKIKILNDGENE